MSAHWRASNDSEPEEISMSADQLSGTTALVTGASRGLGRGVATALAQAGASVVGVARDHGRLANVRAELGDRFTPVEADAADPVVAGQLIDKYAPRLLVLAAGASPLSRPLHQHSWQSFSRNWEVDVQQVFHWTREALLRPLEPGSVVIAFSSGAALHGSPVSGGYAGAKATIRFIASYAADESERNGLGIRFVSVLPQLTPATDLGAVAVAAYAAREGMAVADFLAPRGPSLTPEQAGKAVLDLATDPAPAGGSYLLSAAGLKEL
jgi:NAD(P)-dependent dehydrogenase (short-subunit alcohol dehydrogenase family)